MEKIYENLEYVRSQPERFFRMEEPNAIELIEDLTGEVLRLECRRIEIFLKEGWWFLCVDMDWLDRPESFDIFEKIVFS